MSEGTTVDLCSAMKPTRVFSHYAYGDPLPCYARYLNGDGEPVPASEAAVVYARCERERGHTGMHLERDAGPWSDAEPSEAQ